MHPDTVKYNESLSLPDQEICKLLARVMTRSSGRRPFRPRVSSIVGWT
jgi:hypothetical protein